jgi:hypothetical protein
MTRCTFYKGAAERPPRAGVFEKILASRSRADRYLHILCNEDGIFCHNTELKGAMP